MKILCGPYSSVLESQYAQPPWSHLIFRYGSFAPAFIPEGRKALQSVLEEYIASGIDVIVTPTYRAGHHFQKPRSHGVESIDQSLAFVSEIVQSVRKNHSHLQIWGSVGPYGDSYTAEGAPETVEDSYEAHFPHIQALKEAGVDAVLFETAVRRSEIQGLLNISQELDLPTHISFYVNNDGLIPDPEGFKTITQAISGLEGDFIAGINCSSTSAIEKALQQGDHSQLKIIYPNSAEDFSGDHTACSHHGGEELVSFFTTLVAQYPQIEVIGGCCGYKPEDIQVLRRSF